jgi:UPF0716 protein FxsA
VPIVLIVILCWPFAEIAGFIYVGGYIGILPTIGLTLLSSFIGAILLRIQGIAVLQKMQSELRSRRLPASEMGHGAFITLAGLCLLVPGFLSDIVGLLLFLPPVRSLILMLIARNLRVVVRTSKGRTRVVDLDRDEWQEVEVSTRDHNAGDGPGDQRRLR